MVKRFAKHIMLIKDGLALEGRRVEIPDCSRDDLPQFFVDMGYHIGVEVGVYKAEFLEKFCQRGLTMYGVDPWKVYGDYGNRGEGKQALRQERQDELYVHSQRVVNPYRCTLLRKTSMEAVDDFADESIDFVYIDGHHGLKYVIEDMWEWSKKVRKGGVISGHDYMASKNPPRDPYTCHVKYAVDAFTSAFDVKKWYVLGRLKSLEGEKRDAYRSWLWIKE